ncbi:MAG: hypothetical protein IJL39_05340, partial [Clostridia bacterium]|nr:hypothetical protein [Clostridia bacterium]
KSVGNIAIGFGILFSGLLNMTGAVDVLAKSGMVEHMFSSLGENPFLGYITGAGIAFMLQSSSATVGILQAFSASGLLTFKAIYTVIVGIYRGGGTAAYAARSELFALWMVGLPLSFFGATVLNLPITLLVLCQFSEDLVKLTLGLIRLRRGDWIRSVL